MSTLHTIAVGLSFICFNLCIGVPTSAQGRLLETTIDSPSLEGNLLGDTATRKLIVYVPPAYDTSGIRYPVVYLLHTAGASERFFPYNEFPASYEAMGMFTKPQDFSPRGFASMVDSLIDMGILEPMIIVMPNISTAYGGSFCINSDLNGNYEDYMIEDVVPFIDHTFNTLADRRSRAIAGHCMGGFAAIYLSMKHPDVFALAASHSAELCIDALARASQPMIKMENPAGITGPDAAKPFTSFFYFFSAAYSPNLESQPYFLDLPFDDTCGIREDVLLQWALHDPIQMIPDHLDALNSLKGIFLDVGDQDELQSAYFTAPFSGALSVAGIKHSFEVFNGMHYSHLYTRLSKSLKFFSDSINHKATGPTHIPGGNVSGTWTRAASPYMINGEITVPDGMRLSIEPGVIVRFTGHHKLRVQGSLNARGTAEDSIRFTSDDHDTGWHGIKLISTPRTNDSTIFEYCIFEYGKANTGNAPDDRAGGALLLECDKARVSHCLFRHNMCYHQRRDGGGAGGAIAIIGSPLIEYCEFRENSGTYGSALFIYKLGSKPVIHSCKFHLNEGHGTINVLAQASPVLINNVISHNHTDFHGHVHFAVAGTKAVLINNTIVNNSSSGTGGAIFVNNGLAPAVINSIIYGNTPAQVHLEAPSNIAFHHCLIEGGKEGFSGSAFNGKYLNNIDTLPHFVDILNGDYHLDDNSPCISAGADSVAYSGTWCLVPEIDFEGESKPFPEGTAPDIGAFESKLGHAAILLRNGDDASSPLKSFNLRPYPNPFMQGTTIVYSTRKPGWISIKVYNALGREIETVVDSYQIEGKHSVYWQPDDLEKGIYFLELKANGNAQMEKLICIN